MINELPSINEIRKLFLGLDYLSFPTSTSGSDDRLEACPKGMSCKGMGKGKGKGKKGKGKGKGRK